MQSILSAAAYSYIFLLPIQATKTLLHASLTTFLQLASCCCCDHLDVMTDNRITAQAVQPHLLELFSEIKLSAFTYEMLIDTHNPCECKEYPQRHNSVVSHEYSDLLRT